MMSRKSSGRACWACVIVLALMLALAACMPQATPTSRATPTTAPTATPATTSGPANEQDIIPTPSPGVPPTATPGATSTAAPSPTPTRTPSPAPAIPPAPLASGRVILVSLSRQQLYAYQNGKLAFTIAVETGRPELPTPTGVYHVFLKKCSDLRWTSNKAPEASHNVNCPEHNGDRYQAIFTSPWPEGSPNWYAPTHINYALEFKEGGFYMHDAWWHVKFGLGSNVPHQLPDGSWETGSHGCVGMRIADAERLYGWAPAGTPVYVRANV